MENVFFSTWPQKACSTAAKQIDGRNMLVNDLYSQYGFFLYRT